MTQSRIFRFAVPLLLILITACTPLLTGPVLHDEAELATAAAQTVVVEQTQSQLETMEARLSATPLPTSTRTLPPPQPTATREPTSTPAATATPVGPTATPGRYEATPIIPSTGTPLPVVIIPTARNKPLPCNWAEFVEDVTVPDGTVFSPGEAFTKTWRVRNVGSCEWPWDYEIIFSNGSAMGGPSVQKLDKIVLPNETVEISLELIAPFVPGTYTGFWLMRAKGGEVFGMGKTTDSPMWTRIEVQGDPTHSEELVYEFVSTACEAEWKSNHGKVNCPTDLDDLNRGYVDRTDDPALENGNVIEKWAIVMVPGNGDNGYINGKFPPVFIEEGDDFTATIGCGMDRPNCDTEVRLDYQIGEGEVKTLAEWRVTSDGELEEVIVDLNELDGEWVQFILHVSNLDSSEDDRIIWIEPTIR